MYSVFYKFCINILKRGPVPKHVAFIMDGNRRYAKKNNLPKVIGHKKAYDKFEQIAQWCIDFGIKETTVYALSIHNLTRSKEEVTDLFNLLRDKFEEVVNVTEKFMETGVGVRPIGNFSLIPIHTRKSMAKATIVTKNNDKVILNVAVAYAFRDEITDVIRTIVEGVQTNRIEIDDIDEYLLSECLYTNHSSNPDMVVRTSGEVRFSDFLLWQVSKAHTHFIKLLWPEYGILNFFDSIYRYQCCYKDLSVQEKKIHWRSERVREFLKGLEATRVTEMEGSANI